MKQRDILLHVAVLLLALLPTFVHGATREEVLARYTSSHPLVILGTNNNLPYEFSNSKGLPDGYNADVVARLLKRLGVPYTYKNKEWSEILSLFEGGQVDFIIAPEDVQFNNPPHMGQVIVAPVHMGIAYCKDQVPINRIIEIPRNASVFVPHQGNTVRKAINAGIDSASIFYCEPTYNLSEINGGSPGYLLWNELALQHIKRTERMENVEVKMLRAGANGARFFSYDADLISVLDEEFGRMEQRGEIEELQIKWFYPERARMSWGSLIYATLVLAVMAVVVVLLLNQIIMVRRRNRQRKLFRATNMMRAARDLDGRDVIRFDFSGGAVKNESGSFLPEDGLLPEQYLEYVHPDDRPLVYGHMHYMKDVTSDEMFSSPAYRWNPTGNPDGPWRTVILQSVIEYSSEGVRQGVISTVSDITEELLRSRKEEETTEMFYHIFDNAVLGMAIYSADGKILEGNRRIQEIFNIHHDKSESKGSSYYGKDLFKIPSLSGVLERSNPQELWICTSAHPRGLSAKVYVELHITPVRDEQQELRFILLSARDITDDVLTYRQHKQELVRMNKADEQLRMREEELRILLKTARMRLWTISDTNQTIAFNSAPGTPERIMTWDEFLEHAVDDDSRTKMRRLLEQDPEVIQAASVTVAMSNLLGATDGQQWYALNVLGRTQADEEGNTSLFGLTLNVTPNVLAQQSFEQERQRATESEHQKTKFLNSMTHEIRTPLNSIVGFSEVLPMLEAEERDLIVNTIKENCDKLLRLTDDILTISAMDAKELKFEYKDIDFAQAFDEEFEHLRIYTDQNANVEYLKDNPCEHLMVRIDMKRISQILTNFLGNAVKYTTEGSIRLGYSCNDSMLRIYCQDTGTGISEERQKYVFERFFQVDTFVQGTGMGLSVCKAIAEAMGGHIGVESEEGKGSTFYVDIPIKGGGKIAVGS